MFGSSRIPLQATRNRINEIRDMFGDDRFRGGDLLAPEGQRLLRDRLQRIDVVKVNALHLVYPWIDVAWYGDIDDKKRPIQTSVQHRPKISRSKQSRLGRCRCNQDVDFATLRRPFIEGNDATTDHPREFVRAIDRTIAHAKIIHPARDQGPDRACAWFTGPKHEELAIAKLPENSLRKIDSDRSN